MLRDVFFDLDNTLLDFDRAERTALHRSLTELGLPAGDAVLERYHIINQQHWHLLELGKLTRSQVLVGRFAALLRELGSNLEPQALCRRYETYLSQGHWFIPGAEALLRTLAPRYRLYLATNGTASVQHGRLKSAGIAPYFQGIFISEELGANKPSRAFFDACFSRIPDFSPDTALMIGDSLTSDIQGGINAGIRTCWFHPQEDSGSADIRPDCTVTALEEIPALLETL